MLPLKHYFLVTVLALSCLGRIGFAYATLPQDEVDALNQITRKMGATGWNFTSDACKDNFIPESPTDSKRNISCSCEFANNTCHIVALEIKRFSLAGVLPLELTRLRYLELIDLSYNFLSGSIPREWASMKLTTIALLANRLSGNIPSYLGNFTSLTSLNLEVNQFYGTVPRELGKLINLQMLILSSNNLSGNLPVELAELKNLTDFRISDNNFSGTIPDFIQNWKQLKRLEMQATGLVGPIPSSISVLEKMANLRISDINATGQAFPDLSNMTGLSRLILRNCNMTGEVPSYIWRMSHLRLLDLSFNKLHGTLPTVEPSESLVFIFLSYNFLSGSIPMFRKGMSVDLSYNNFTWQNIDQPACMQRSDLNLNLFRSSSMGNDIGGACMSNFDCQQYSHSLYINCGGGNVKINGNMYEGDDIVSGGAATFYQSGSGWGLSSTGDFMDDNDFQNKAYVENSTSTNINELYQTARISPLSLTYYHHCLENGNYTVSLHFAEIQFTNDNTYSSLGRRIFDIYIQDELIEKNFNIEVEAPGVLKPLTKTYNASVANNILEIRFFWAGKGSTRIPARGVYGPLISAISVDHNFKIHTEGKKTHTAVILVGVLGSCLIVLASGTFCWRCYLRPKNRRKKDFEGTETQTISFTLKQIKAATNNFDSANKIGEGGFGPVYKGLLADGTVVAVKQLSSKSSQGNREFLNEIGMISCLQHPNLVKLHGCCVEGDQLLLVYEYMENNSLSRALFGSADCQLKLDWRTRQKICVGIARGLAFLHEDSRLRIVHRDIKGTNVLLDRNLNPKISDFGLAKLDDKDKTHISTKIAGTIGYMAPEYALWGYLTYKADVYSFGIVALEIVSGQKNSSYGPEDDFVCLLDWAWHLQQIGKLQELVDHKLGSEFDTVEAERMIKVALLSTNASPSLRPSMSEVVRMLEGTSVIPDEIPEPNGSTRELQFKAIRDRRKQLKNQEPTSLRCHDSSSPSDIDVFEIDEESSTRFRTRTDHDKPMESRSQASILATSITSSASASDFYDINLISQ